MSEFKGTPGPWHVGYGITDIGCTNAKIGGHAKLFDVRGWGYLTGNGHGGLGLSYEEAMAIQKANACLVAAAPELLDALIDVQDFLKRSGYDTKMVKYAIAKALGETK